jgi:hypothetical protein
MEELIAQLMFDVDFEEDDIERVIADKEKEKVIETDELN